MKKFTLTEILSPLHFSWDYANDEGTLVLYDDEDDTYEETAENVKDLLSIISSFIESYISDWLYTYCDELQIDGKIWEQVNFSDLSPIKQWVKQNRELLLEYDGKSVPGGVPILLAYLDAIINPDTIELK